MCPFCHIIYTMNLINVVMKKKLSLEINYFCQFIFEHVFLDELSALNRVTICYSYSLLHQQHQKQNKSCKFYIFF